MVLVERITSLCAEPKYFHEFYPIPHICNTSFTLLYININHLPEGTLAQPTPCPAINLAEQFDRYYPAVHRYFRYRGADPDSANDLAAGVFEHALAKLHTFDPRKAAFNTWLFAIARHAAINHWKTQARRKVLPIEQASAQPTGDPLPEETVIHEQRIEALLAALKRLDEREREIVALKFAGAFNNRQIAGLVNLTESNVGVILYRALQKIKGWLFAAEGLVCHD
jgi:RNA polymerase sigma factor (sigma-70 family)